MGPQESLGAPRSPQVQGQSQIPKFFFFGEEQGLNQSQS